VCCGGELSLRVIARSSCDEAIQGDKKDWIASSLRSSQ
jgi:hypothetical protein